MIRFLYVGDARFGGIGDHKAEVRAGCNLQIGFPTILLVGVEDAAEAGDWSKLFDCLTLLHSSEDGGIQALLGVDELPKTFGDGLDGYDIAVKGPLFIEDIDHP